jgi:hypothetical protein
MRIGDYSAWIWNEIKESKRFTLLNVLGVWINICVVIVFLALASGIEDTTIQRITENMDLFTLEVTPTRQGQDLQFAEFSSLGQDPRVEQIVPILAQYVELGLADCIVSGNQVVKPGLSGDKDKFLLRLPVRHHYTAPCIIWFNRSGVILS